MKKKIFKFLTHPILHIVVSVAALWFFANAWLAGGFFGGLAIGLMWGIIGTFSQIKLHYALYPKNQVPVVAPVTAVVEEPKLPAQKKKTVKKAIVKRKKRRMSNDT